MNFDEVEMAFCEELQKIGASNMRIAQARSGRRPISASNLLKKDSEGKLFKNTPKPPMEEKAAFVMPKRETMERRMGGLGAATGGNLGALLGGVGGAAGAFLLPVKGQYTRPLEDVMQQKWRRALPGGLAGAAALGAVGYFGGRALGERLGADTFDRIDSATGRFKPRQSGHKKDDLLS